MTDKKMIEDPLLSILKIERGYGASEMHVNVLLFLVKLLHLANIKCNYAHAKSIIQKDTTAPLELKYKGRRYHGEISFWIDSYLVILDFAVINAKELNLKRDGKDYTVEVENKNG